MGRKRKHAKKAQNSLISHSKFIEVNRRAKLICDALDAERDEKVEEIAIESIKFMTPEELVVLGEKIERHGFYSVGEAITAGDLEFFGAVNDDFDEDDE
jgi:hypothetical protein